MCFSANASFGAGVVLAVIGIVSIKKVQHPSQIIFAGIPLLFCVQQVTEGFLWLALSGTDHAFMRQFTTYAFLFFAQVLWPICIPLSILLLEKNKKRRLILKVLLVTGALVSIYLGFCLFAYDVDAKIIGYHILYGQDYPAKPAFFTGALYIIASIVPAFVSSIKRMWWLGATILISYLVTKIFYTVHIVSVWCFFASVISIVIIAILHKIPGSPLRPV